MQKFTPQQYTLKNQKTVTIRESNIEDTDKVFDCMRIYIPESEFVPKLKHEMVLTKEQEKEWLNAYITSENSIHLMAEYDNKVVGDIYLRGSDRVIMKHTATIGIGIINEWQNTGLGTALFQSAIEWAKANPILELLCLEVYSANILGISLYKKMGFEESGVIKNFFKHDDAYFDNVSMTLSVK